MMEYNANETGYTIRPIRSILFTVASRSFLTRYAEAAIVKSAQAFEKDGVITIPMPAILACARKP